MNGSPQIAVISGTVFLLESFTFEEDISRDDRPQTKRAIGVTLHQCHNYVLSHIDTTETATIASLCILTEDRKITERDLHLVNVHTDSATTVLRLITGPDGVSVYRNL
jgi:hypothetical protein